MPQVVRVTLYRFAGERQVTGYFGGYPVIATVTVEKSLTLLAHSEIQLANMINVASIDGWRVK